MLRLFLALFCVLLGAACSGGRLVNPFRAVPTPPLADGFGFPLNPLRYGPYVQGVTGPLNVDTRYGVQNPALGYAAKCFHDREGTAVPFRELYHAGEDWFQLNANGQVDTFGAALDPVHAVGRGVVFIAQQIGSQGWILVLSHRLEDGSNVYSAYWHVDQVQVRRGDVVEKSQTIAVIHDQGGNSHLHWEIRAFGDASDLFPADSAGGRGTCNGRAVGVAYTWDDDLLRARPEYWGYFDPVTFVERHGP